VRTDSDGYLNVEGFKGAYEITCMEKKSAFTLDGKNDAVELRLG
jgi:hypothetical protein